MLDFLTKPLRFVRIFLAPDNLDQLRAVVLKETSEKREVVDLGLAVIVNSDADVEAVSKTKIKPNALIQGYNYITGKTLFTCSPEEHAQYIKTFPLEVVGQQKWIVTQKEAVVSETARFVEWWLDQPGRKGASTVDFGALTFDLTFSILSKTFLGADYDARQQADFELMAKHLNRYLLYQVPPISPFFSAAKKRWAKRTDKIIADRQALMARPDSKFQGTDLLSTLIRMGVEIDDLTRRSLSQAYWAGTFTHSSVIAAAMYYVGKDRKQLDYLLADLDGHALHVAKEALRMHPGAPIYDRGVAPNTEIAVPSGHVFKPGSRPFVCPHIIGTDPVYWPDPMKFEASRFTDHHGFQSKAFIPFGYAPEEGGRACTGRYYALEVLPWIISTIFDKFDVEVVSDKIQMTEYAACAKSFIPMLAKMRKKQKQ